METQNSNYDPQKEHLKFTFGETDHHSRSGRVMGGLLVLAVGVIFLLRQLGTVVFPDWLFTWPVLLISIGLYIGARHNFRVGGWPIMLLIGGVFLFEDFYPQFNLSDYIWPIVIIAVGLMLILPRKRSHWAERQYWRGYARQWKSQYKYGQPYSAPASSEDFIDSVSIFGGVHKVISSKEFKGGDIVNIFGGCELNLMQADIKGRVVLEITQIFGGTKIIVPSDWEIQSKSMVAIFGNVEDKRNPALVKPNPEKVLVIEGTSIFAGVDIISY